MRHAAGRRSLRAVLFVCRWADGRDIERRIGAGSGEKGGARPQWTRSRPGPYRAARYDSASRLDRSSMISPAMPGLQRHALSTRPCIPTVDDPSTRWQHDAVGHPDFSAELFLNQARSRLLATVEAHAEIERTAAVALEHAVVAARYAGITWDDIGQRLNSTRQGAWKRFHKHVAFDARIEDRPWHSSRSTRSSQTAQGGPAS